MAGVPGAMSLAQSIRGSSNVGGSRGQQGSGGGTGNRAVISTDSGGDQAGAAQSGAGRQYSGGGLADENNPVAGGSSVSGGGFGVDMASGFEAGTEMTILPGKIHEGLALLSGVDSVEEFYEEPIDDETTKNGGWEDSDDPARSTEEDPVNGPGALEEREFASGEADFHHEAWEEDDAAGETEELAQKEANGNDLGEGGRNESLADIADTEFEDDEGTSAEYATDPGSFAEDGHTGSAPIVDEGDGVTDVAEEESGADTEVAGISGAEFGGNEDPADSEAKPPSKADSAGEDVAEAPGQESPEGEDAAKAGPEEDRPTGVSGKGEKRDMVQLVREHRRTLEQGGERPDLSGMSASEWQAYIAELKNTIERERSLQRDLDTEITRLEGDRTGYVLQVGAVVTGTLAGLDSVSAVASGIAEAVGLKQGKAAGAARDFGRKLGNTINDFAGMLGIDMSEVLFGQFSGTGAASASGKAGEQATDGSAPSNGREAAGDGNANSAIANTGDALGAGRGGAEAALGLAETVANTGIAYEDEQNGKGSASGITGWKVTKKIAQRASGDLALITNPVDAAKDVRSAYREFGKQGSVGNSGHVFRKTARATNTATQSITHQIKRMNEIMGIRDPLLNKQMDTLSSGGRMLEATSRLTNPDAGLSDRIGAGQTVLREGTKVIQGNVGKSPTTKKVLKKFTNEGTQRVVEGTAQVVGALESSVEGYRLGSRIIAQNQWSLKHHSKLRAASDTRLKVYREMLERTEQNQQGRRSSSQLR